MNQFRRMSEQEKREKRAKYDPVFRSKLLEEMQAAKDSGKHGPADCCDCCGHIARIDGLVSRFAYAHEPPVETIERLVDEVARLRKANEEIGARMFDKGDKRGVEPEHFA